MRIEHRSTISKSKNIPPDEGRNYRVIPNRQACLVLGHAKASESPVILRSLLESFFDVEILRQQRCCTSTLQNLNLICEKKKRYCTTVVRPSSSFWCFVAMLEFSPSVGSYVRSYITTYKPVSRPTTAPLSQPLKSKANLPDRCPTPSSCLSSLEKTRRKASKVEKAVLSLWTTLTDYSFPTRDTLPELGQKGKTSDPRLADLQNLVSKFLEIASGFSSANLEFGAGAAMLNIAATTLDHECVCLDRFLHVLDRLGPHLYDPACVPVAWTKEFYDALESVLKEVRRLRKQMDALHFDLHAYLEPGCYHVIPETRLAEDTAVSSMSEAIQPQSGLRRRRHVKESASGKSDANIHGTSLLNESRKKLE